MTTQYDELAVRASKILNGKVPSGISAATGLEPFRLAQNLVTSFDDGVGTIFGARALDYSILDGFRMPLEGNTKNLFTAGFGKDTSGNLPFSRIGSFHGVQEVSYSDRNDPTDYATVGVDEVSLVHNSFNFENDGVEPGDILYIPRYDQPAGTELGLRRPILTVVDNIITVDVSICTSEVPVHAIILKLRPAPLFAVPGSGPQGQEQTFLTVNPYYFDPLSPGYKGVIAGLLHAGAVLPWVNSFPYRTYPLIPPVFSPDGDGFTGRADGLFDTTGESTWWFKLILYPALADGTGPDLTKPILADHPIVDSTLPLDQQDMLIDYKNGMIHCTVPPRAGDALNPNSYAGPTFKLWAVYAAYTLGTDLSLVELQNRPTGSCVRALLDCNEIDMTVSIPSFIHFNNERSMWSICKGTDFLTNTYPGKTGFETHAHLLADAADVVPGFWLDFTVNSNGAFVVSTNKAIVSSGNSVPLWLCSGVVGSHDPCLGVTYSGVDYRIEFDIWGSTSWRILTSVQIAQGTSNTPALLMRKDAVAHGMTDITLSDVYGGVFAHSNTEGGLRLNGLTEGTIAASLYGYAITVDTTTATSSVGTLFFNGAKRSGAGPSITSLGTTENLMVVSNNGSATLILKGNGNLYVDGAVGNFDDEHDALACQDLAYVLSDKFSKVLHYNAPELNRMGVMQGNMLCLNQMFALQLGAIGELYGVVSKLCSMLNLSYDDLRRLVRA